MTITKRLITKYFTSKLIREEKRWLSLSVCIKYNLENETVYISSLFNWGSNSVPLRHFNLKKKHRYVRITKVLTDEEAKDRMKKVMKEKPTISSQEIAREIGIGYSRVNRMYMSVKRKLL